LNVFRAQHYVNNSPTGVIMRTFEVPGAGGFLLSTRSQEALEVLPEGESGAYFGSVAECCEQIDRYLASDHERRSVAAKAHETVATRHLYSHRAMRMLEVLSEMSA
jgi:spore maturation protein CgeB